MACKTVALRPALDRRPFKNEQSATRERAALAKRAEALPALRGPPDESQTCLGILGFAQMRRALRDDHFQRRPHMGCAEVPAMALPSRVPRTIWIWSAGLPCGLSATSPISEATSTCSCTGILSYVFVSQLKYSKVASLNAPIAVNAAAWMRSRSTKSCKLERLRRWCRAQ